MNNPSVWSYFFNAGPIVKLVMLLLITASIASWTVIFERLMFLKKSKLALNHFEKLFWGSEDLSQLYKSLQQKSLSGLAAIFSAGFKEFLQLNQPGILANHVMSGAKRAMRVAQIHENEKLESYLPLLATIGSVSPYVGLFGTVWGIMSAFSSLSQVSEASIAMVAPGISEALVATALGLFAAIPAVIAYNRFVQLVDRLLNRYEAFEDEFASLLYRHTQQKQAKESGHAAV